MMKLFLQVYCEICLKDLECTKLCYNCKERAYIHMITASLTALPIILFMTCVCVFDNIFIEDSRHFILF